MKRMLKLLVLSIAITGALHATTIIPMSVEELTRGASFVVEAHAADAWTDWNAERTVIYTYTRFSVSRSLKGSPASSIVVKQAGGTKDGLKQILFGVRHFQVGENAVLFLRPSEARDGTLVVVGLMQGNFRTIHTSSGQTLVTNGVSDAHALTSGGKITPFGGANLTLQELESRVLKAAGTKAVTK